MWEVDVEFLSKSRFKKYSKNHPFETESCYANLMEYFEELNKDKEYLAFFPGYLHPEGENLVSIGHPRTENSKETRLYVYIDAVNQILYLLGIGNKESQKKDILEYKKFIRKQFKRTER